MMLVVICSDQTQESTRNESRIKGPYELKYLDKYSVCKGNKNKNNKIVRDAMFSTAKKKLKPLKYVELS